MNRSAPNPSSQFDLAPYLFHQGTNFKAYEYLGSHLEGDQVVFRVWAPKADSVFLAWDKNEWSGRECDFYRITSDGVWEFKLSFEDFPEGSLYKFKIVNGSSVHLKADPYAFSSETLKQTASVFLPSLEYSWTDEAYMSRRKNIYGKDNGSYPMNVYECHLGSWDRDEKGNYLSWEELGKRLSVYLPQMGYTHIELLPVTEHPFDGSWGYQVCGYYSPTSRFGPPKGFMSFVDQMHSVGIGVIMDWVPAHFPKDEHGLYEFDGALLYEYQGMDRMENRGWGTRYFDVGRNEVQCFLISNLFFWIEKYHVDGFRMDAVSSMLYLDFDKMPGEWFPNPDGSNINMQAVSFFQRMNSAVKKEYPEVLLIAEESAAGYGITRKTDAGGLGFDYKWNMGWMNDTLSYFQTDPIYRKYKHDKLTFPMMYAFSEHYILPFSHDETVHGKKSLIGKQCGSYEDKFSSLRAMMCYMMAFPGKKLSFMGNEFAQFIEWNYEEPLEWFMLDYPKHRYYQRFIAELNHFYLNTPPLWQDDFGWNGFHWSLVDEKDRNLLAFERFGADGRAVLAVYNFSPVNRENCFVPVSKAGCYRKIFSSDYYDAPDAQSYEQNGAIGIQIHIPGNSAAFYTCDCFDKSLNILEVM